MVLIIEDNAYGMIRWKQAADGFPDFGMTFGNPDFVAYAEAYGAKGSRVASADGLVPALEAAFAEGGVHLVTVPVDYSENKRVLVVFGANWCYDCHVLDATFHSKTIAPLVNANYHVVHVNVGDEDKNLDLAEKYGVPLKKGIPGLAILDPDGRLVYSQKEGEFENSVRIGPADVTAFLKKWAPPHAG